MDGNKYVCRRMDSMKEYIDRLMNNVLIDERLDKDRWMDGWMDGWMDEYIDR